MQIFQSYTNYKFKIASFACQCASETWKAIVKKKNSVTFHSVRFFSTSTSSKSTNQRRDGEWLHDSTLTFVIWKERWYFIRKLSHCWFLLICIWYTTFKIEGGHMCKNVVINIQYWLSYEFPRCATCTILNSHPLNLACTVQYLSVVFFVLISIQH